MTILLYVIFFLYNHIFYFKVRLLNYDIAIAIFNFIEYNTIEYANNRFFLVIYSILPISLKLLNFGFNTIVYSYVFSFSVPMFITIILLYKSQTKKYIIVFILSYTLFNSYAFYYPIAEYWLGTCLYFILYKKIDNKITNKDFKIILIYILIIINLHPSLLFPITYLILYMYINNTLTKNETIHIFLLIIIYILIKSTILKTQYETNIILNLNTFNFKNLIANNGLINTFIKSNHYVYILILFYILYFNRHKIKNKLLLLTITYLLFTTILVLYIFHNYNYSIYVEGNIKVIYLFIPIILYNFSNKNTLYLISIFLIINSVISLNKKGIKLQSIYNNINNTLKVNKENTIYYTNTEIPSYYYDLITVESVLINLFENRSPNFIGFTNKTKNDTLINEYIRRMDAYKNIYFRNFDSIYKVKNLENTNYELKNFTVLE